MCLLALFYRAVEDAPVVVGANREESYARGGEPPQVLEGLVPAVGGRDPVAGGTWLAVNRFGLLVAVTNRPKVEAPANPRSRGLLVRDLLGCANAAEAARRAIQELTPQAYAGCNLLCVDGDRAVVIHAGDWIRVRPLPPGLHVLTSRDVNDLQDRRTSHALTWLSRRRYRRGEDCATALKKLCGQTGNGSPPICLKGEKGGTVSSSVIVLRPTLTDSRYFHAPGPPDITPYEDCSHLVKLLERG
jgi:uncharacterized protein with NRDE domain